MKRLTVIFLVSICSISLSQSRPFINVIVNQISSNINAYFLLANRPAYGVSSYITPEGYISTGAGIYFNKDVYDIPFDISYGVSGRLELSSGITGYTKTYNYLGETVGGIGDANIGLKYLVHQSKFFDHVIQMVVKIPTASKIKETGTGKFDLNLGAAQGFFYKRFGYDIGLECNFLARKDIPGTGRNIPHMLRSQLDSLRQLYDYKYETELAISFSPSLYFSDNIGIYTGYTFTRNTKLNYNTNSLLYGLSVSTGDLFSFSVGGSYGLDDNSGWQAGLNINFLVPAAK